MAGVAAVVIVSGMAGEARASAAVLVWMSGQILGEKRGEKQRERCSRLLRTKQSMLMWVTIYYRKVELTPDRS